MLKSVYVNILYRYLYDNFTYHDLFYLLYVLSTIKQITKLICGKLLVVFITVNSNYIVFRYGKGNFPLILL